jgi:hypothetical protein
MSDFGVVVETGCRYFRQLHFAGTPVLGLRLDRISHSSVVYEVGFFVDGSAAGRDGTGARWPSAGSCTCTSTTAPADPPRCRHWCAPRSSACVTVSTTTAGHTTERPDACPVVPKLGPPQLTCCLAADWPQFIQSQHQRP